MALARVAAVVLASGLYGEAPAMAMRVVEYERDGFGGRLTARFDVQAHPDQVFTTLTDDGRFAEFMPYVVHSEAADRFEDGALVKMRVRHFGLFDFTVVYVRSYRADRRQVSWHEVGGFFRRDDGSWTLAPTAGGKGTAVTYQILLDPGFFIPDFLLSFAMRQGLPELGEAVRRRAESGGTWKRPR